MKNRHGKGRGDSVGREQGVRKRATIRPVVRNAMVVLATTASTFLVLTGVLSLQSRPGSSRMVFLSVLTGILASLAAAAGIGVVLSRRLDHLVNQRDAFFRELTRLSKIASLGEVSSGIAHDLNNPLAIMNEEAGWILDLLRASDVDQAHASLEILNSAEQLQIQIGRSREIIRRILSWARDTDEDVGSVDVNSLLDKTLYLLESDLQTVEVRVVKKYARDLPPAAGSAAELRQVLLNLMKNALDAMKTGGGTLTLSTEETDGGRILAAISDTGHGIPPDLVPHLFEPFFSTKPEGQGSGLGLAISSWIVKKLGGTIDVTSEAGRGSTFYVALPAA